MFCRSKEKYGFICLHFDTSGDSKYPVLYLLDDDAYFYSLSGIVKQLSSFGTTSCPESVVIAIPNTNRNRDLMPYDPTSNAPDSTGIEKFTNFLEKAAEMFIKAIDIDGNPYSQEKLDELNRKAAHKHP